MDEETVEAATKRWVEAGLIDEATAVAIREFEAEHGDGTSRQLTTILAGMGAALIGAGILVFLGANWEALPRWGRSAILIGVPVGLAVGALLLDRRGLHRPALGTWILAAIAVGPSVFLLTDLYAADPDPTWPLAVWGAIVVPMGHAFRTRLATAVGLLALTAAAVVAGEAVSGIVLAGGVGTLILGAGIMVERRAPELTAAYRFVGVTALIGPFVWAIVVAGWSIESGIEIDTSMLAGLGVAIVAGAAAMWGYTQGRAVRDEALLVTVGPFAMALLVGLLVTLEAWPDLAAFLALQGVLLAVLVALVTVGIGLGSTPLVNLVIVGFFLQVVTLLARLADVLSGALTLVVAGIVLLAVAIGLERVRRRLLERLPDQRSRS